MSKVTRKEVTMWCAEITGGYNGPKEIRTHQVYVTESAKQYRVNRKDQRNVDSTRAIRYASQINKCDNNCLFATEREALEALDKVLTRKEQIATRRAEDAQEDLYLITQALEKKQ